MQIHRLITILDVINRIITLLDVIQETYNFLSQIIISKIINFMMKMSFEINIQQF